jgi:hypothetical protein
MTNTALKAQIDSQITNETTANAITPTKVGTNMKLIVDYIDDENEIILNSFSLKQVKISVSQTDISTLHTTGKLLFRNLDESVKVVPIIYYFKRTPGTPYTSGSNIMYVFDEDTNIFQTINKPFLANTGGYLIVNASANFHSNIIDNNVDLILKSDEEFTGGTEGFDVYLVYNEITL